MVETDKRFCINLISNYSSSNQTDFEFNLLLLKNILYMQMTVNKFYIILTLKTAARTTFPLINSFDSEIMAPTSRSFLKIQIKREN